MPAREHRLVSTAAAANCRSSLPSSRFHSLRRDARGVVAAAALMQLRQELRLAATEAVPTSQKSQKNRPAFFFAVERESFDGSISPARGHRRSGNQSQLRAQQPLP